MCVCVCVKTPLDQPMAGLPLGEPPLRAAEGGSDRTRGVYQAIEHEPLAGDDTKNGVETSRGGQATLSAPKYQWNTTKIGNLSEAFTAWVRSASTSSMDAV